METRSMAKAKAKAKRQLKRQHEMNSGNAPRKSPRLASAAASKTVFTTKINDLNDDCLMKIFGLLDHQSLFNVAIANEWLRPAARVVYKQKFGKILVTINDCDEIRPPHFIIRFGHGTITEWDEINIIGLKKCLRYLRCFGPSITNLKINYNESTSERYNHVHQYINDYCADSLTCLQFKFMPNIAPEQFQKVFVHVDTVVLLNGVLGEQWPLFAKCFPNLRRLNVDDVLVGSRLHGNPFKLLEHLGVENLQCDGGLTTIRAVADMLDGAHELKDLRSYEMDECVPIDELLTVIKDCPSITGFVYSLKEIKLVPVDSKEVRRIARECPALIELFLPDHRFACVDAIALIRQLDSLEEFKFQMEQSECADLIKQLDGGGEWMVDIDDDGGFNGDHTFVTLYRE